MIKDKKNLVIGALLVAVVMMSIGYAAFAQTLQINGTAAIDANSKWQVEITGIEGTPTGTAEAGTPTYTTSTATFSATLKKPGDSVEYTITVKNKGTIEAKLDSLTFVPATNETKENSEDYILYSVTEAPTIGSTLAANGTATYKVTATYNEDKSTAPTTEQATKKFSGTIEYVQAD